MEGVSQQGREIIKTVLRHLLRDAATLKGHSGIRAKAGTFCADFVTCVASQPAARALEAGPPAFAGGPGQAVPIPGGPGGRRTGDQHLRRVQPRGFRCRWAAPVGSVPGRGAVVLGDGECPSSRLCFW